MNDECLQRPVPRFSFTVDKTSNLKIRELFQACDTSGRGLIGPQEFNDLCQSFGIAEVEAHVIFLDLDHDGDGQIDFSDFKHGFNDYLTPGSRRGSFQVNLSDGNNAMQQLLQMEKKHVTAKKAWEHFVNSVGENNVASFLENNESSINTKKESPRMRRMKESNVSTQLEHTLTSLITDVQNLHEEYKTLETSFRKEREAHAVQLAALGEELDQQLAKAEAKAKDEARQEAQRQMDSERKKITQEMETKLNELTSQIKTFEKVEGWLSEEAREKVRHDDERSSKRIETESENRKLRSALVEAQMKATLLQNQLTQKRNEYLDLYQEFHSEKVAATEYRNQCDLMQNHLSILSQANRVLSDANDCFTNSNYGCHSLPSLDDEIQETLSQGPRSLNYNDANHSKTSKGQQLSPSSAAVSNSSPNTGFSADLDRDSGTETLLDELRAESESSPLPSGRWSELSSTTPEGSPLLKSRSSVTSTNTTSPEFVAPILPPPPTFQSGQTSSTSASNLPHRTFKVILAGDAAVGKTSFIERACHGHFAAHLSSTIGVDFRVKMLDIDGHSIALQLWDTAGQERFRSLTKSYFRRADGVILMYDVASEQTFLSIRHWVQNVEEGAGRKLPIVICGNKVDLRADWYKGGACISHEEGVKLSREYQTLFIEVSPKTGFNVLETLLLLTAEMSQVEDAELRSAVNLAAFSNGDKERKRSCCSNSS